MAKDSLGMPALPETKAQKQRRYAWLLVIVLAMIVLGVLYASRLQLSNQRTTNSREDQATIISEIKLGALQYPEAADKINPPIIQKPSYTTNDQLVLRVTTAPDVDRLIEVNARLLTLRGEVIELDPPAVEFAPGTNGFCCWQIEEPGEYTLQIFRPERVITTIPLKVIEGFDQANVPALSL